MKLVTKSYEQALRIVRDLSESACFGPYRRLRTVPVGDPRAHHQPSVVKVIVPMPMPSIRDLIVPLPKLEPVPPAGPTVADMQPHFDRFLLNDAPAEFTTQHAVDWFIAHGFTDVYGKISNLFRGAVREDKIIDLGWENGRKVYCLPGYEPEPTM